MPTTVTTNADHTVTVNFDGVDYKFRWSDVAYYVETRPFNEVADIFAANVEHPALRSDGTIAIETANFNDSFDDMIADLLGENEDADDWDDEDADDWDDEDVDDDL